MSSSLEVRQLLTHSYYAFYAKFPKLTPIQLHSAAPLVQGRPCLLTAPTASGKTQAYLAPLVQRYFAPLRQGTATVLIVSPTRALVNDLFRRLTGPLERCGVELSRRTGDFRSEGEAAFAGVVLTTPESLDSVLCRQPRWLGNTRAIVLDEVHLVANTCRGSQLELLLARLDAVVLACQSSPAPVNGAPQPKPGQSMPGQPMPGQSMPGQSVPGQSVPSQSMSVQPMLGQSVPSQPMPGQSVPGQSMPGQSTTGQSLPVQQGPVQRVAVSATVEDTAQLQLRFLGSHSEWLNQPALSFPQQVELVSTVTAPEIWRLCLERFRHGVHKLLFFLPTRKSVEEMAQALKEQAMEHKTALGSQLIYVHHAALSRANRLLSEKSFLQARQGVLLTTSSLEVGLDIGDIDAILLWGAPPDVTSLLQRVGRGGRRGQPAQLWCLCPTSLERLQMEHLLHLARGGVLCSEPLQNFFSVLFQQAASLAFQNRGGFVASSSWWQRLGPRWQAMLSAVDLEYCLEHWQNSNFYRYREGRYFPDQRLERMQTLGKLHSNIADQVGDQREVVEAETGRTIGFVTLNQRQDGSNSQRGAQTVIGGARRRILSTQGQGPLRAMITSANVEIPSGANAKSRIGIGVAGQGMQVRQRRLTRSFGEFVGAAPDRLYLTRMAGDTQCFHFSGHLWGLFVGDFFRFALRKIKHGSGLGASDNEVHDNGLYLKTRVILKLEDLERLRPVWLERVEQFGVERQFSKRLHKIARMGQCGPWFGQLPLSLQLRQLLEISDFQGFIQWFGACHFETASPTLQSRLKLCLE